MGQHSLQDYMLRHVAEYLAERGISAESRGVIATSLSLSDVLPEMIEQFRVGPLPIHIPESYIVYGITKHNFPLGREFISGPNDNAMTFNYRDSENNLYQHLLNIQEDSFRISTFKFERASKLIGKLATGKLACEK